MPKGYCPECDAEIRFDGSPRKGHEVTCHKCGAFLKVSSESPIELDWADEDLDDEDWEDFDDDDEDDDF